MPDNPCPPHADELRDLTRHARVIRVNRRILLALTVVLAGVQVLHSTSTLPFPWHVVFTISWAWVLIGLGVLTEITDRVVRPHLLAARQRAAKCPVCNPRTEPTE